MAQSYFRVASLLALLHSTTAMPAVDGAFKGLRVADVANITWTVDQRMLAAFECRGQSCLIADTAGSTGRMPIMKAEGADESDIACIVKHNPALKNLLQKYNNSPPDGPKQVTSWMSSAMISLNKGTKGFSNPRTSGKFDGTCAPNVLIYAKGTMEPGIVGITIGPQFTRNLPAGWSYVGVDYDPDIAGDFCLGLPGGMVVKDYINDANRKCPTSNLFLAGYSQGAMVIRNGLARANPTASGQVKGVITFGDPFDGAPIKGYNGPIEIYCAPNDGVCTGNFELGSGHLSYVSDDTVAKAKVKLFEMAQGKGDNSCCQPATYPEKSPTAEEWASSIRANGGKAPQAKPGTTVDQWAQALGNSNGGIPQYSTGTRLVSSF